MVCGLSARWDGHRKLMSVYERAPGSSSSLRSGTSARILGDVPTVQQPNSVAVDPRSGTVLVTGSAPGDAGSLQIVTPALLPGG
jgi:ribosomal protein L3